MAAQRDDNSYLWDMLTAARAVESFVRGRTDADYLADLMLRSAVERQIEIIGEVRHERIWRVVTLHIPELICQLEPLVPPPPESIR